MKKETEMFYKLNLAYIVVDLIWKAALSDVEEVPQLITDLTLAEECFKEESSSSPLWFVYLTAFFFWTYASAVILTGEAVVWNTKNYVKDTVGSLRR